MFVQTPATSIPSYDSDGTNITIPIASLPGLTSEQADPETGDIRAVIVAILNKFYADIQALPKTERPGKLTMRRSTMERPAGLTRTYVVTTILEGDLELVAES
jgi:hypothetical protein